MNVFERQELLLFGKEHKLVVNWGAGVQILWSPNWRKILSWSWVQLFPGLITWEARDNLTSPFQCKNIDFRDSNLSCNNLRKINTSLFFGVFLWRSYDQNRARTKEYAQTKLIETLEKLGWFDSELRGTVHFGQQEMRTQHSFWKKKKQI